MKVLFPILAWLLAVPATQQPQRDIKPAPVGTGRIAGTVVDAESGRSVRFAKVRLVGTDDDREAVTDEGGAFAFESLRAGAYQVEIFKPGYLETKYGQTRPGTDTPGKHIILAGRTAVVTLSVPLSRGGVISGVVRDDRGEPAFEALVTLSRWMTSLGVRRLVPIDAATTDERGVYRFSRLPARDYVINAAPSADAVPETKDGPHPFGFASSFFPGVPTAAAAEPISLGVGEQKSGVDLQLPLVALGRVTGAVIDANGRPVAGATVTLTPKDADSGDISQRTETEKDGRFTFERVVPGAYTVVASTIPEMDRISIHGRMRLVKLPEIQMMAAKGELMAFEAEPPRPPPTDGPRGSASNDVQVAGGGESSSTLTLEPARKVAGRFVFEGKAKPPVLKGLRVDLANIQSDDSLAGANVNDDGTFELATVPPGRYVATVSGVGAPWSIASAVSGGLETLDFFIEVPRNRDVRDLTITLRDRQTELTGAVLDGAGNPAGERTVVVFPADDRLWAGWQRVDAIDLYADGTYAFRDLRPGRYLLAVVDGVEHGEWLDPNFLRRLVPAAVAVTLGEAERKVQDLRVR